MYKRQPETTPLVVLINEGSASASELLAAALQDTGRAVIIGSASFGKGTQQILEVLPSGGALTVTNAYLVRTNALPLSFRGIIPHICSAQNPSPTALIRRLTRGTQPPLARRADRISDPNQARALCPAQEGNGNQDLALAQALLANQEAYRAALEL